MRILGIALALLLVARAARAGSLQQLCDAANASSCPDTSYRPVGERPSREPSCNAACRAENRRQAAEAERYALSHIPEPNELPRPDTVAERERGTVRSVQAAEAGERKALLAEVVVTGSTMKNPYVALPLLGLFVAHFVVSPPSLDLDRLQAWMSWRPRGQYVPPPKTPKAFPDLKKARPKTPVQGGGKLRKRWTDPDGNIYEWDYENGRVEKYDKRGKHKGEYDPETGEQTKPPDPTRKVKP